MAGYSGTPRSGFRGPRRLRRRPRTSPRIRSAPSRCPWASWTSRSAPWTTCGRVSSSSSARSFARRDDLDAARRGRGVPPVCCYKLLD